MFFSQFIGICSSLIALFFESVHIHFFVTCMMFMHVLGTQEGKWLTC